MSLPGISIQVSRKSGRHNSRIPHPRHRFRRKTAGGAGGYEPGKIAADESKALGRQAWLEYMARLQKAGCRQMDTTPQGRLARCTNCGDQERKQ